MSWSQRYLAADMSTWKGRGDAPPDSAVFQRIQGLDLRQIAKSPMEPGFAVLGFRCDEGVRRNLGRTGAVEGPQAIRKVFAPLPLHKKEIQLWDAGDIVCTDGDLEASQEALAAAIARLHQAKLTPLVLGGGHEVAYAHYLGLDRSFPNQEIHITNIDAHLDMRPLLPGHKGSSGTPFLQIANHRTQQNRAFAYTCLGVQKTGNSAALLATARAHGSTIIFAEELEGALDPGLHQQLTELPKQSSLHYLTLCLDAFAAAYAPGVSAPQACGIRPWVVIPWLRTWAASGRFRSYDIAELNPSLDCDQRTAKLAAHWLFEIIHHHTH